MHWPTDIPGVDLGFCKKKECLRFCKMGAGRERDKCGLKIKKYFDPLSTHRSAAVLNSFIGLTIICIDVFNKYFFRNYQ